jgi:hypothetical protein
MMQGSQIFLGGMMMKWTAVGASLPILPFPK